MAGFLSSGQWPWCIFLCSCSPGLLRAVWVLGKGGRGAFFRAAYCSGSSGLCGGCLVRPLLDLRVSVTGGVHLDLVKRVLRDIKRSGQAPEEIIQQVTACARMCLVWLLACKLQALLRLIRPAFLYLRPVCAARACTGMR